MVVTATLKRAPLSAQKARLVVNQIRGLPIEKALNILEFGEKKASHLIIKVLRSAMHNAEHNNGVDIDELRVCQAEVGEGPRYKRVNPRAKGRADRKVKRTCHIMIGVTNYEEPVHGTES